VTRRKLGDEGVVQPLQALGFVEILVPESRDAERQVFWFAMEHYLSMPAFTLRSWPTNERSVPPG
jgi:hypothetical protein